MSRALLTIIFICNFVGVFSQTNDAELLSQITEISIDKGKLIKYQSFEIQINNRAGEEYSKISIPYTKDNKVDRIEAFIKDNNGNIIRKLKKNEIVEKSAIPDGSFYTDYFVKEFSLRHNTYPYSICYAFQEQCNQFLYIEDWSPVLSYKIPTRSAELKVTVPKDYKIKFLELSVESAKIEQLENQVIYTWKASYSQIIKPEIYLSRDDMNIPRVIVVPSQFFYEKPGTHESWISYGNWNLGLLDGMDDLPEIEKNKINNLVKDIKDKNEQIKILYHHLQDETRYVNISIKTGGLKPYPASYVAKNKYGDCKALSNYFKSILNLIGVQSFYTTVNAGEDIEKIYTDFPSQQFNHIILCVPYEKDTIWLDCTSDGPFGYLGTFTQNRLALLIDKDKSSLVKTPALKVNDVIESRKIDIIEETSGSALCKIHNNYRGYLFENIFEIANSLNNTDKARIVRDYLVPEFFELIDYHFIDRNRDSSKIELEFSAKSSKIFENHGNETLIRIIPFGIPLFEKVKDRKLPVQIDYPIHKIDSINYSMSGNISFADFPKDIEISGKYGYYKLTLKKSENQVDIFKQFVLNSGKYSLDEYIYFYDFISKIREIDKNLFFVINNN